jgi:hypothetical protein
MDEADGCRSPSLSSSVVVNGGLVLVPRERGRGGRRRLRERGRGGCTRLHRRLLLVKDSRSNQDSGWLASAWAGMQRSHVGPRRR